MGWLSRRLCEIYWRRYIAKVNNRNIPDLLFNFYFHFHFNFYFHFIEFELYTYLHYHVFNKRCYFYCNRFIQELNLFTTFLSGMKLFSPKSNKFCHKLIFVDINKTKKFTIEINFIIHEINFFTFIEDWIIYVNFEINFVLCDEIVYFQTYLHFFDIQQLCKLLPQCKVL